MALTIESRTVRRKTCGDCHIDYDHVTGFIEKDASGVAAYFASCHGHPDHEAAIDAVLGTWGVSRSEDHVTFSCLLRPSGAMVVEGPVALDPGEVRDEHRAILGQTLTREEALSHPLIEIFWQVVDAVARDDPAVHEAVYGMDASA